MSDNLSPKKEFDSSKLLLLLFSWRKPLIIITTLSLVLSIVFSSSWFITPKFRSTVIMFPTSSNSISKALLSDNPGAKQDILEFGEDAQTEQMLQILNSSKIRSRVVQKFELMKHYGIDANSQYKNTLLQREYDGNITFKRTEFMAVKISVLDKDPQMAADIANSIADLLDSVKNEMQRDRAKQGFKIVEAEYLSLKNEVSQMEDSLSKLRKLGVNDYETQAEMMNQQLAIELARNNTRGIKALEEKLSILSQYGGPYVSLRDALEYEKKQLSIVKTKYDEAKIDATQALPQKFVVESAYKSEKKAYPIRWLIMLTTTCSVLLLTLVLIILFDRMPQFPSAKKKL
jgi:capsule polysaccharide export protein KpsE/RkpR